MDSLKAGLETVKTISCEQADLKGRVKQLEGKVGNWENELNQIKLTFKSDEEIEFMTHCSKAALDSIKEHIETCGNSNSYFRSKICELKDSTKKIYINVINKEATLSVKDHQLS